MKKDYFLQIALLCFLMFTFSLLQGQYKLGGDLDGENPGDRSGSHVSLSGNGHILAIGSPNKNGIAFQTGQIKIYQWKSNDWVQMGSSIEGKEYLERIGQGNPGRTFQLSESGTRIIVGSTDILYRIQAGSPSWLYWQKGRVQVYEYNNSDWVQVGNDIYGLYSGDQLGQAVSISPDGNWIAVGAQGRDESNWNAGQVRIFEYQNGIWTQIGQNLNGDGVRDAFGRAVDLSRDGKRVIIGTPNHDNRGHVKVFERINGFWTQLGDDIDGEFLHDLLGGSVSISANGDRITFSEPGYGDHGRVRVLDWDGANWVLVGQVIEGTEDFAHPRPALSGDGKRLVTSMSGVNINGARTYDLVNGLWEQSHNFKSANYYRGTISLDGTKVAFADYIKNNLAGQVKVYELKPFTPENLQLDPANAFIVPLTWEDPGSTETVFEVWRNRDRILDLPANTTTYTDTLTIFGNPVLYEIRARGEHLKSDFSNSVSYEMPSSFAPITLNYDCYNPANQTLYWTITNPNQQNHPIIWAQWWSDQRDTVFAVPGTSTFSTVHNPGSGMYGFDDNVTGIWYPKENYQTGVDIVLNAPLTHECGVAKTSQNSFAQQAGQIFGSKLRVEVDLGWEEAVADRLEIYPNPSQDNLEISWPGVNDDIQIKIQNVFGQIVLSSQGQQNSDGKIQLNLDRVPAGTYILHAATDHISTTRKLIKQ